MMTLCRCENGTAMFNVGGMLGEEPPTDLAGMIAFAEQFGPPSAVAAVRGAQPIGDTDRYCVPSNRWRRYDKVCRFPEGLLVFGDAICSFNPIYGQGMTVAALDAVALRGCLRRGERGLAHRFFRESAKVVGVAWQMAVGSDLALPEVKGHRSAMIRGSNFYTDRVLAAAECDPFVAESFLKAICFVDPPSALLRPSILMHVATAQRRNSRSHTIAMRPFSRHWRPARTSTDAASTWRGSSRQGRRPDTGLPGR